MKKLLHERLREWSESGEPFHILGEREGYDGYWDFLSRLADEIERYYIPRPRFEDGEPVELFDSAVTKTKGETEQITRIAFTKSGFYFNSSRDNVKRYEYGEPVKRPSPKVLDADGVEIKVGDTVWAIDNPTEKWKVIEIHPKMPYLRLRKITVDQKLNHTWCWVKSDCFTHKEPDSLEKLRDEMADKASFNGRDIPRQRISIWVDRLSALIERVD